MITYIDEHRGSFGIEPICRVMAIAPSSYYAARSRSPSARAIADATLKTEIARIHAEHFAVYGVRKAWRVLRREGIEVGSDWVGRLMRSLGLAGATRTRRVPTTMPAAVSARPADLVERVFAAAGPNRLWVADLTYVWTRAGFCYAAFVIDVFSRRIVGWRVAANLRTDLTLDALEMALFARGDTVSGLVHHSDRGVQYLAIKYSERLAEVGAVGSVGSRGDSYDNASPRRSTGCTRPSSSAAPGPGDRSMRSSSQPRTGSISGTAGGSTAPVATCPRPSSRRPTISAYRRPPRPLETQSAAPRNPGRLTTWIGSWSMKAQSIDAH